MATYSVSQHHIAKLMEMAYIAGWSDAVGIHDGFERESADADFLDWCDRESTRFGLHLGTVPVPAWIQEARRGSTIHTPAPQDVQEVEDGS